MSQAQVSHASSDFVCTWTTGGLDAGRVHLAGALDIETAPPSRRLSASPCERNARTWWETRFSGKMVLYRLTDRGRALLQALLVAEEVARR